MKQTLKLHHELYPHITEVSGRTDKAIDYASWTFAMGALANSTEADTGVCFTMHSHSISGEGKTQSDMKNGQVRSFLALTSRLLLPICVESDRDMTVTD